LKNLAVFVLAWIGAPVWCVSLASNDKPDAACMSPLVSLCPSYEVPPHEYFLIPGYVMSGGRKGGEITLATNGRYDRNRAAYVGTGIVLGGWVDVEREMFIEIQRHFHGYFLFGDSGGIGAYKSNRSHGLQVTVSIQFLTPFLMFVREQIQTFPKVIAKKPQFGLMFKFPLPVSELD